MAIKVGIAGGIGSGKSTVCRVFRILGAPVFEADRAAKVLMNEDEEIKSALLDWYGSEIYNSRGELNRPQLASIIFNDKKQLQKVNEMVHPKVRAAFLSWADKQAAPYVVHEAAILFESGFYKLMDATILVSAPEAERVKRVSERDGLTPQQVSHKMKNQWTDEQKRKLATVEIVNDNRSLMLPEILKLDKQLRDYGKIW